MLDAIQKDAQRIAELGGPAQVARRLGFDPTTGTQRVQNWISRGVPVRIKYNHPEIFGDRPGDREAA